MPLEKFPEENLLSTEQAEEMHNTILDALKTFYLCKNFIDSLEKIVKIQTNEESAT